MNLRWILAPILTVALTTASATAAPVMTNGLAGSLIAAGGGAGSFSSVRAFCSMVGTNAFQDELNRIAQRSGPVAGGWLVEVFDYAMADAWQRAGPDNVAIPNSGLEGATLGNSLVSAGTSGGMFSSDRFFSTLFTPRLWRDVESDIDATYGSGSAARFSADVTMFFEDLAPALRTGT